MAMLPVDVESPPNIDPPPVFSEDDRKYKCCCEQMRVKTGLRLVAVVQAVLLLGLFILYLCTVGQYGYRYSNQGVSKWLAEALAFGLMVTVYVLLFRGLQRERRALLLPFLGWNSFVCVCVTLVFLLELKVATSSIYHSIDFFFLFRMLFVAVVISFHMFAVYMCYRVYKLIEMKRICMKVDSAILYHVGGGPTPTADEMTEYAPSVEKHNGVATENT